MSTTNFLSYGVKHVWFREAGSTSDYQELKGLTSEASVSENDPEATEYEGLTEDLLDINYKYGSVVLTLAWARWDMTQVSAITGWNYDSTSKVLKRPATVPDKKIDIIIEFNTGFWGWNMPNAKTVAKTDQAAVKTDMFTFAITATALSDDNGDTVNFLEEKPTDGFSD